MTDDGLGDTLEDARRCAGDAGAYWYCRALEAAAKVVVERGATIRGAVQPDRTADAILALGASANAPAH